MIHPGRTTLNELLLTARDPRFVVRWLRKEPIGATLRAMAAGELPISHSTLDALPPSLRVRYLRHMLISAGTLPPCRRRTTQRPREPRRRLHRRPPEEHSAITG